MNSVQLVGRLTRDPDVRYSNEGSTVAHFTVACDRRYKKDSGDNADFISCVAFGKTAEFVDKYFHKGERIGLTGRIQTGSYEKQDGTKIYTTDVVAENVEFTESKKSSGDSTAASATNDGFMNIPEGADDEGLPFN